VLEFYDISGVEGKNVNVINKSSIVADIQNEYRKIDEKWLKLHYSTFVCLVFFGFLLECILGIVLYITDMLKFRLQNMLQDIC
jgi:diguanylate cyclase